MEEFEALLNESFDIDTPDEGSVVKGRVIAIEAGQAIIDVGYKMEGRVDLKEFAAPGEDAQLKVGDTVEAGQTICIIEAMKMMTQIPSDRSGTVEAILVGDGDTVAAGAPLMRIR